MNLEKQNFVPGYLKIRQHIIKLISRSGNEATQIESCRKLAQQFSVTHPTVLRALKDLVNDGFLVPTQRGGYLTRPSTLISVRDLKVIGIIFHDGKQIFHDNVSNTLHGAITAAILRRNASYRIEILQNCDGTKEGLLQHIEKSELDGLIWLAPHAAQHEIIAELRRRQLPVMAFGARSRQDFSACWDFEEDYRQIIDWMQQNRKKDITVIGTPYGDMFQQVQRGIESIRQPETAVTYFYDSIEENCRHLEKQIQSGHPADAAIFTGEIAPYMPLIAQMPQTLIAAGEMSIFDNQKFTGLVIRRAICDAAEWMAGHLDGEIQNILQVNSYDTAIKIYFQSMKQGIFTNN